MAFWTAWLLAFAASLLGIGYFRRHVVARHTDLSEARLDVLVIALFAAGFILSAVDHLRSEAELAGQRNTVASAAATVDFILNWPTGNPSWSSFLTGGASYIALGRRGSALLVIRSQGTYMKSLSNTQVSFKAFYDLNAPGSAVSATLHDLAQADLLQIGLPDGIPNTASVESGSIGFTISGSHTVVLTVRKASIRNRKVIIAVNGLRMSPP